jgi:hypothetical protein
MARTGIRDAPIVRWRLFRRIALSRYEQNVAVALFAQRLGHEQRTNQGVRVTAPPRARFAANLIDDRICGAFDCSRVIFIPATLRSSKKNVGMALAARKDCARDTRHAGIGFSSHLLRHVHGMMIERT